jgi:hypothetical protein
MVLSYPGSRYPQSRFGNTCTLLSAFSQTVYVAGVHVHGVHQAVFASTRCTGLWGHGFLVHRVHMFGATEAQKRHFLKKKPEQKGIGWLIWDSICSGDSTRSKRPRVLNGLDGNIYHTHRSPLSPAPRALTTRCSIQPIGSLGLFPSLISLVRS